MSVRFAFEIRPEHVGRLAIKWGWNKICYIPNFMGRVSNHDIGKRVYVTDKGQYQVENDEQLRERLEK